MKKLVSTFLCIALFTTMLNVTVMAVSPTTQQPNAVDTVKFTVSSAFSSTGGTAKIFVDIGDNSSMSAAVFKLKFDTALLNAESVEIGTVLQNGYTSKNILSDGTVAVSYVNTAPVYSGGRLFEVEFEIVGDIPDNSDYLEVPVQLDIEELKGYDYTNIKPDIKNGFITIVDTPYGDANQKNGATPSDTLLILNYAVGLTELTDEQLIYADVNGDGKVNSIDAMLILQFTAGVISNYPIFEIGAPQTLQCTEKDETYVNLSWDESEFAIGYNLYLDGNKINETPIVDTRYTVTGLEQNTRYAFSVSAVNTLKESAQSSVLDISTNKADRNVVFKDYDGSIINTQIVLSSENAIAPANPERTGYTFTGWDTSLENITEDTVITATYKINSYTVSFDSCDGSNVIAQTKEYESKLDMPPVPQRTDYTFMGWYYDSAYTKKWDFESDTLKKNTTLFAKWQTWSEWNTVVPSDITDADYIVESREETKYRTKTTTTDSESSKAGWTRYDAQITSWSSWSGWQNASVGATDSRQVQTRWIAPTYKTQYNYSKYTQYSNGNGWTGPSIGTWNGYYCGYYQERGWSDSALPVSEYQGSLAIYKVGGYPWYNQTTRQVIVTNGYTQYSYRDANYTYYYYKWSDWSDWSNNSREADDNTEIQTRTVYRYIPIQK